VTIDEQVLDDDITRLSSQWVGILQQGCGKDNEEDFEDRMIPNDGIFPECL